MSKRKVTSVAIAGGRHPDLKLVETGGMLFSSSISGADPATGELGSEPEQQFEQAFRNLRTLTDQAGVKRSELGLVTVCIPGASHRPYINDPWLATFPDEGQRPARKTNQYPLPDGMQVQLHVAGVKGQGPRALEIPGFAHRDPLPAGVQIGDLIFSSVVGAQDPSGNTPDDSEAQLRQAFENLEILVKGAGGSKDDILHVYVFLRDREDQPGLIKVWLDMFPEEGDRPARKTIFYDELKGRSSVVQLQMVAAVGRGKRHNYEIPGVGHHDPIPMGASLGNLVWSSGMSAAGPGESVADDPDVQAAMCFKHLGALTNQAGVTTNDVGFVTILVRDYTGEAAILKHWRQMFPNPADEPARHIMQLGSPGTNNVQLHMVAVS